MNIFYVDHNPEKAAQMLGDRHVIKMAVECTQMLAQAYHMRGVNIPPPMTKQGTPYRPTHVNHPCVLWTLSSESCWRWVKLHGLALCEEYKYRFPNSLLEKHACEDALRYMDRNAPVWLPRTGLTTPPMCMPTEYRRSSVVEAYRLYYRAEKRTSHNWTIREKPSWIEGAVMATQEEIIKDLADELFSAAELQLVDPDQHRPMGVPDDQWEAAKALATEMANGRAE